MNEFAADLKAVRASPRLWVVYEANGGLDGKGDRVFGPYRSQKRARATADYMNMFPLESGRCWVLPLRPVSEAPEPLSERPEPVTRL